MKVYHGSTMMIRKPDVIHSKSFLDFGPGFYVTSYKEQAERWAYRKGMRLSMPAIVNVYDIGELSEYRIKRFTDTDSEWLNFVCNCRNGKEVYKGYDAVIGNVANDDVFKCFNTGIFKEHSISVGLSYTRKIIISVCYYSQVSQFQ